MAIVPIIDVTGLGGAIAERKSVAEKINSACEDIGFFCITGHGIDPALAEHVRATAIAFFNLPEAQKRQIERQPPGYRGYIPFGGVSLARSAGKMDAAPDLNEAFSMGPLSVPSSVDLSDPVAAANFASNRFPSDPREMQEAFEIYYQRMSMLASRLLSGFALALGTTEDWFDDKIDKHISNLRVAHYPAQQGKIPEGSVRAGEHTDYGCLTILLTDDSPGGLEVKGHDDSWQPVPYVPGSFVVNIGDLMAQWSNDRYVSTAHRVANPPAGVLTRRLSVAFFHQPNYDAVIECLPACSSADNPARYAPITSGQHRLNKLNRSSQAKVA